MSSSRPPLGTRIKHFFAKVVLVMLLGLQILAPQTAYATGIPTLSPDLLAYFTGRDVALGWKEALLSGVLGAAMNMVSYFTRKIAYDSAVYLASGDYGQKPLIFTDGWDTYLGNVAKDSLASGIEEFGQNAFGLSFCNGELDLNVQVFLQIGLGQLFSLHGPNAPQPDCTFNQLRDSWSAESFEERYGSNSRQFLARTFSSSISVDQSDFGVAIGAITTLDNLEGGAILTSALERLQGDGFKDVKGYLSGNITTPSELVKLQINSLSPEKQAAYTTEQIAGLYGASTELIIPQALQIFAGTFVSQLLDNVVAGLFKDKPTGGAAGDVGLNGFFSSPTLTNNRRAAESAFSFLFAGVAQYQFSDYQIVTEFRACPGNNPSLYNCVIDSDFGLLLDRSAGGEMLTIRQALDEGLLHADWPLINPRSSRNTDTRCFENSYCYSNLQKLRKVRIVPLGFEVAALKADPDNPQAWTLGKVVDNFENCRFDEVSGNIIPDPTKPYCHLIDPNWIIRAPAVQCKTKGPGPQLLAPNTTNRREECIDTPTCVVENSNGSCDAYGYCTKEKNVWSMNADSCPAEFATCRSFTNTRTNTISSYLTRSIDYGTCSADSIGCLAYSTEKSATGEWISSVEQDVSLKEQGRNQILHFNERMLEYSCSPQDAGCTSFYPAERDPNNSNRFTLGLDGLYHRDEGADYIYVQKAPDYLGCYDIDPRTPEINKPQVVSDLAFLPQGDTCAPYAAACLPSEVGCDAYTPVASGFGPTVPAIVGNNFCANECVGYDTYKQIGYMSEQTNRQGFEPEVSPLYFIADSPNAVSCSAQYVGCDEFTNIDAASRGGEGLEYYTDLRYCEKPTGTNEQTYYTWEGSVDEGYVLRIHRVLTVDQDTASYISAIQPVLLGESGQSSSISEFFAVGSPAYVDDSKQVLEDAFERCNATAYTNLINNYPIDQADPDCRAFYDASAKIYYRLESQLVTVSESCQPLRKTVSYLAYDAALTTAVNTLPIPPVGQQNLCEQKGGLWADDVSDALPGTPVCQRCVKGGQYINGSCVYSAIPSESNSCPAEANLCRLYVGNTSANVRSVLGADGDTFEPLFDQPEALVDARNNWYPLQGISVVGEAVQVGQHSLQITPAQVRRTLPRGSIESEGLYELSFWARGTSQNVSIRFEQVDPIAQSSAAPVPCQVDTDNGDNPFAAGIAGSQDTNADTQLADQCLQNGSLLLESYCEDGVIKQKMYTCGNGCGNGACSPGNVQPFVCTTADADGDDPEIDGYAGETDGYGDQCRGDEFLIESYCSGNDAVQTLYRCAEGCTNGACNALPNQDIDFSRNPVSLDSFTFDPILNTEKPVSISGGWKEYRFGPVEFTGDPEKLISLVIERLSVGNDPSSVLFIDNLHLTRVQDQRYLIKDSWKYGDLDVPLTCDSAPQDGLPGEALGCRAYTNSQGNQLALTGFESLCRAEAVGCSPLFDTYNTVDGAEAFDTQIFYPYCTLANNGVGPKTCAATVYGVSYTCAVTPGEFGCYIDQKVVVPSEAFIAFGSDNRIYSSIDPIVETSPDRLYVDASTVVIPADPADNDPLYLTIRDEFLCANSAMGCQSVATQTQQVHTDVPSSFAHTEVALLNRPDNYLGTNGTLCRDDLVGCSEFSAGATVSYFKDPLVAGNALCEYRESTQRDTDGSGQYGWYFQGVGTCSQDSTVLCTTSSQCGEGNTCEQIGNVPCYEDYLQRGGEFGLWSNDSAQYEGFVGTCEPQYNGCVELIDRGNTDNTDVQGAGDPYYVLFNDKLASSIRECADQGVSLREGCVLFDRTDLPNKLYDTQKTYEQSETKYNDRYGFVPPVTSGDLDANVLLKVDRDRICSEWLACKNSLRHIDESGRPIDLCYEYRACQGTAPGVECTDWAPVDENPLGAIALTEDAYVTRDTSWYGEEYVGLSLFNKFQIKDFVYLTFDTQKESQFLAYEAPAYLFEPTEGNDDIDFSASGCFGTLTNPKHDWQVCGFDSNGRCFEQKCIYPVEGGFPQNRAVAANNTPAELARAEQEAIPLLTTGSCKVFPEIDAPFPQSIATGNNVSNSQNPDAGSRRVFTQKNAFFSGANVCQDGNCACEYKKVVYKNGTYDYWPMTLAEDHAGIPQGVCETGEKAGQPCERDVDCDVSRVDQNGNVLSVVPGSCSTKDKEETHIGNLGYCLEYDLSRPINGEQTEFACLTWLPIDVSASNVDVYNLNPEAGYYPPLDAVNQNVGAAGEVYCTDSNANGRFTYDTAFSSSGMIDRASNYVSERHWDFWRSLKTPGRYTFVLAGETFPNSGLRYMYAMLQKYAWFRFGTDAAVFQVHNPQEYQSWVNGHRAYRYNVYGPQQNGYPVTGNNPIDPLALSGAGEYNLTDVADIYEYDIKAFHFLPVLMPPLSIEITNDRDDIQAGDCQVVIESNEYKRTRLTGSGYVIQDISLDFDALRGESDYVSGRTTVPARVVEEENTNPWNSGALPNGCSSSSQQNCEEWPELTIPDMPVHYFKETFDNGHKRYGYVLMWDWCYYHPYRGYSQVCVPGRPAELRDSDASQRTFAGQLAQTPWDSVSNLAQPNFAYLAVMIEFDSSGQFVGIQKKQKLNSEQYPLQNNIQNGNTGGTCLKNENLLNQIPSNGYFASVVEFYPRCTEFTQVYKDGAVAEGTNKAWTDRVWAGASERLAQGTLFAAGSNDVSRSMPLLPFGSTSLDASQLTNSRTLRRYYLQDVRVDGIPFACQSPLFLGNTAFGSLDTLFARALSCTSLPGEPLADGGYGSYGAQRDLRDVVFQSASGSARRTIQQLFLKAYKVVSVYADGELAPSATFDVSNDDVNVNIPNLNPVAPRIFSIDPYTCFSAEATATCDIGQENNITVNQRNGLLGYDYDGDGRDDDDKDRDGYVDDFIATESFTAVVNFFAYADHNQMPLRRVVVDWQDGSRILDQKGFYKNRKPLCAPSETQGIGECVVNADINFEEAGFDIRTGFSCSVDADCARVSYPTCSEYVAQLESQTNSDFACSGNSGNVITNYGISCRTSNTPHFGDTPRACVDDYFTFTHSYTCTTANATRTVQSVANEGTRRRLFNLGLSAEDKVCVFQPRVQLLDNWGYCNGVDANGNPTKYWNDTVSSVCDSFLENVWTSYAGEIVVVPRSTLLGQ